MNTLHLKYVLEVARTRSITRAADNLYMAQPNLSKAIRELEDSLGILIFERTSRGVVPTRKGEKLIEYAKCVLDQVEKIERLSKPVNSDTQTLSVAIPRGSYISGAFTDFVVGLDYAKPIELNLKETNSTDTVCLVANREFALGIIRYKEEHESYFLNFVHENGLMHQPIWEFHRQLIMSTEHPLAKAETIRTADLANFMQLMHGDNKVPYLPHERVSGMDMAHKSDRRIYLYERCSQFDILSHVKTSYMWVSPVPKRWLDMFGLTLRDCAEPTPLYRDALVYPGDYKFENIDIQFINKLFEIKNSLAFSENIQSGI